MVSNYWVGQEFVILISYAKRLPTRVYWIFTRPLKSFFSCLFLIFTLVNCFTRQNKDWVLITMWLNDLKAKDPVKGLRTPPTQDWSTSSTPSHYNYFLSQYKVSPRFWCPRQHINPVEQMQFKHSALGRAVWPTKWALIHVTAQGQEVCLDWRGQAHSTEHLASCYPSFNWGQVKKRKDQRFVALQDKLPC